MTELEEHLRGLLREALDYLDEVRDVVPYDEGWQSDELQQLLRDIRAATSSAVVTEPDDEKRLGGILNRFLTNPNRPWYYVREDALVLDGEVYISEDECKAILRAADGWIDSIRVVGQADPDFYSVTSSAAVSDAASPPDQD